MELPASLYEAIVQACRLAYPHEACGLLSGPSDDPGPINLHQLDNVAEFPRFRYAMDPAEQVAVWQSIDAAGYRVHAIWHSHTVDTAEPSPEDLRHALDPDVWHLIIALPRADGPPVARLWKVVDGCGIEQDYVVTNANAY